MSEAALPSQRYAEGAARGEFYGGGYFESSHGWPEEIENDDGDTVSAMPGTVSISRSPRPGSSLFPLSG